MADTYKIDLSNSKRGFSGGFKAAKLEGGCEFKGNPKSGTIMIEGQKVGTYENDEKTLVLTVTGARGAVTPTEKQFRAWFK